MVGPFVTGAMREYWGARGITTKYTAEEGVIFLDVASLEVYFFMLHIIRQISRKRNILNFIEN